MFNGRQSPGGINGVNPLIYTGSTPNMVTFNRRPTVQDGFSWPIGMWWIIPITDTYTRGEVWTLVSKADGINTWKRLKGAGSGPTPPISDVMINKIFLTTPGAGTYTPTTDMIQCYVECIGGGGGTAGIVYEDAGIGGGAGDILSGGGSYTAKLYTSAQIGTSQPYVVGAGGTAGVAPGSPPGGWAFGYGLGGSGGNTTFGVSGTLITAGGGQTSQLNFTPGSSGGAGGTASGGDININGYGFAEISTQPGSTAAISPTCSGYAPLGFSFPIYGYSAVSGGGGAGTSTSSTGKSGASFPGYGGGCTPSAVVTTGPGAPKGQVNGSTGGNGLIIITEYIG